MLMRGYSWIKNILSSGMFDLVACLFTRSER